MERKIYYNLAIAVTITALITAIVLVFFFHDYYNSINLDETIDISLYDPNLLPEDVDDISFYDITLDDGNILRISRPFQNIKYLFIGILPPMAGILVITLVLLYLVSSMLTRKIIEPIKTLSHNIESILSGEETKDTYVYKELRPFLNTIEFQKRELDNYIASLKKSEKIRRDFTANVSHELKTPLTSIIGFAEMIEKGIVKGDDIVKSASIIHKEGSRLLELIDSIINLSKLDDVNLRKDFTEIDLYSIVNYVVGRLEPNAKEKNVKLKVFGQATTITGNQRMIEDLVFNLIENSIKYNKPGGQVDIHLSSNPRWGYIKVRDTGIGIPEKYQSRVFERFYRVDKSRSKRVEGTGLGLSIVKHTVEHHGGKISLSSVENEGTTIEVQLPK